MHKCKSCGTINTLYTSPNCPYDCPYGQEVAFSWRKMILFENQQVNNKVQQLNCEIARLEYVRDFYKWSEGSDE